MRTFAIGDIHGCHKELTELLLFIFNGEKFEKGVDQLLFIGDYVDRGPKSKDVIETLIKLKKEYPNTIFLRGNHEDMFLSYMGLDGSYGGVFIMNGGATTLLSYLYDFLPNFKYMDHNEFELHMRNIFDEFSPPSFEEIIYKHIPEEHKKFLSDTILYHDTPNVTYVHAAVMPKLELDKMNKFTLVWADDNRDGFFSRIKNTPWKKMLVHGHTPIPMCEVKSGLDHNRINIDTGCVYGTKYGDDGVLTCLVVDETLPPEEWKLIHHDGERISWKT